MKQNNTQTVFKWRLATNTWALYDGLWIILFHFINSEWGVYSEVCKNNRDSWSLQMVYPWRGTKFCQGVLCFENVIDFYYSQYQTVCLNISCTNAFYPKFDEKCRNYKKIKITTLSAVGLSWTCSHETHIAKRKYVAVSYGESGP